ncbi:MAG: DUF2087 domain-containing protein [Burkholderiales bacterium]|nr:DUF2087 domain-containing protein [Burkholderiales bacterium]
MSETLAALERLAVKQGVTLGNLARADLQVALALASLCLPVDASCTEPEVNAALKGWLAGTGAMLRIDHVELRRTLIDFGLWQRDGYGRAYRRAPSIGNAELASHVEALRAIDAGSIVAGVRARREVDRARRKALNDASRSDGG